jgi:hypothetical protein
MDGQGHLGKGIDVYACVLVVAHVPALHLGVKGGHDRWCISLHGPARCCCRCIGLLLTGTLNGSLQGWIHGACSCSDSYRSSKPQVIEQLNLL